MSAMDREALLRLAAKCEAASGADDGLTAEVHGWVRTWDKMMPLTWSPHYTGSLDAAMTLVPKGHWPEGSLGTHVDQRSALEIHAPGTYDPVGKGWAVTPALALTAACLRAHAALAGE